MLITILGNDISKKEKKLKEVLAGLRLKKPDANFAHHDFLDLNEEKFEEMIKTVGSLFEEKNIYLLSNIFLKNKIKKVFFDNLEKISQSENAFVLSLDTASPKETKDLEKKSFQFYNFTTQQKSFDIFLLSNALQNKDKKNLWLKYHQALNSGLAEEQIYNNLFFSLKTLALAEKFSLAESGLKNYPYQKANQALKKNWTNGEASKKLFTLIQTYNQSRFKGINLKNSIEKFILDL